MRKVYWISLLVTAVTFVGSSAIAADISTDVTFDFFSKYIWRGQNLNDDPVFQPGASIAIDNLTVGIWGNMDLTNINDRENNFSEVDYYIDYSNTVPGCEMLGYSFGLIYYDFPGSAADGTRVPDTTEFYWGLGLDVPLSPSVTVYHDLDEADGTYIAAGVSHAIENVFSLSTDVPVGIELSASAGWADSKYNEYYWGVDGSEMQDLTLSLAMPFKVGTCSITPRISYVTLLGDDLRASDTYNQKSDYVVAGISLGFSF